MRTIAVVGSGPSSVLFNDTEDVTIALNGAISLPYVFDYFIAVDAKAPERDYWNISRGETRLLGKLVSAQETRPHTVLEYVRREWPELDTGIIGACGNVAQIGLEFAYTLRPHEIRLYGIDFGNRCYFDGPKLGGTYAGRLGTGHLLKYMQALIDMIRAKGIAVTVLGSEDCRIH